MAAGLGMRIGALETPIRSIWIYSGKGVYGESVTKLMRLFGYVQGPWEIKTVGEKELEIEKWDPKSTLFILPGGKAGEYDGSLGEYVPKLKEFVKQGGFFFSVCGGSYFASQHTVYQMSPTEVLERERSLALFEGSAEGPLVPSSSTDISFHHGALEIEWQESKKRAPVLVSGGGRFVPNGSKRRYEVLATYADATIAVVKTYVGKGRAILSSLHLGYHASDINVGVYQELFPVHDWKKIVASLEGTEAFRIECFAKILLAFSQ